VSDCRFVIDEQAFNFNGHEEIMLKCFEELSDLLQAFREKVQLLQSEAAGEPLSTSCLSFEASPKS
jgi:hypothetical protein